MSSSDYEFLIIGGGLSGIQLANQLAEEGLLKHKKLAIVEKDSKSQNDKTWCFWEKGEGKWDSLVHHSWKSAKFIGKKQELNYILEPYSYKMVRSIDFYQNLIPKLKANPNIDWIEAEVASLEPKAPVEVSTSKGNLRANKVFDSRVNKDLNQVKYPLIQQHFKGWIIETKQAQFDAKQFTMMDFSLTHEDHCCFTYILPLNDRKALVEYTFFTPKLVEPETYDQLLKTYLEKEKIRDYEILETEFGVIPMTAYPFWKENRANYLKIGTGGGWVKASSGYSFKNTEKQVNQIIQLLKDKQNLNQFSINNRHHKYDLLFLEVLAKENSKGVQLFEQMYSKNSIQDIFKFLDEESNVIEEIKLINSFEKLPFYKALFRSIK